MSYPTLDQELLTFAELDADLVAVARNIKVLSSISWPKKAQARFLEGWRAGKPRLPEIRYPKPDFSAEREALARILRQATRDHPVGRYLRETAQSYLHAATMLENMGKPAFTRASIALYGQPGETLLGTDATRVQAADHFVRMADEVSLDFDFQEGDYCVLAETLQRDLSARTAEYFHQHEVEVLVDPNLAAKAVAGAKRIRIRSGTCFTRNDFEQLLNHEAFVHTLTALNGREQPYLRSMGLGAPRTTAAQEGLATFSELVTGAIDVNRLKRISLRIHALDMGMKGADFIEIFRFFLDAGQSEQESYQSAARLFRGGDPAGRVVFTKDSIYLSGLIATYSFFRWAMHERKLPLLRFVFAGRVTFGDVMRMAPFFDHFLAPPIYVPPWLNRIECLAAFLAFSLFNDFLDVEALPKDVWQWI